MFGQIDAVRNMVSDLGAAFDAAGHRLYLVGGIVRDQQLNLEVGDSADFDLTTDARPDAIRNIVEPFADVLWTQGERFGTIGLKSRSRTIEITTHRAEHYNSESRKPEVRFGDDVAEDLSRRDFTINAMAVDVTTGELVDPWGGAADLKSSVLRTPLSPTISFTDDPLRMLRAARFMTRFGLQPSTELVDAATALASRTEIVAIERIGVEMQRLLALPRPGMGVRFLVETGVLAEVLARGIPELVIDVDLADRAGRSVDAMPQPWTARLAALLTATVGQQSTRACGGLRLASADARRVALLIDHADMVVNDLVACGTGTTETSAPQVRRWAHRVAVAGDAESALVLAAQIANRNGGSAPDAVSGFAQAYRDLAAVEDLTDFSPNVDGAAIMALLNMKPGPLIGEAVEVLLNARFDRGPLTLPEEEALLRSWCADREGP